MNAIKNYYHSFIDGIPDNATDAEVYEKLLMLSGIKKSAECGKTNGYKTLDETRAIMQRTLDNLAGDSK